MLLVDALLWAICATWVWGEVLNSAIGNKDDADEDEATDWADAVDWGRTELVLNSAIGKSVGRLGKNAGGGPGKAGGELNSAIG